MSDINLSKAVRANLLSLQNTATLMSKTQERLATGNKVNSALDNPTNFFTASALNSRASDMASLMDSMASGIKTLEAADNGLKAITKTVESMQSTLRQARQDKSFQTGTFEVTDASTLKVNGGQFASETEIKLQTATPGTSAKISGATAYTGPTTTAVTADADSQGAGARTVIELDAVTDLAGKSIKVDGKTVAFAAGDDTVAEAVTKLQSVLGSTDYTITAGTGGDSSKIVIENKKVTGYASTSPVVDLGSTAATKASASFIYNSDVLGASVTVDGNAVVVGGTATEFAANMQSTLGSDYTVALDSDTDTITVTKNAAGAGNVAISGTGFGTTTDANTTFTLDTTLAQDLTIAGETISLGAADTDADVIAAFEASAANDDWALTSNGTGDFTLTARSRDTFLAADISSTQAGQLTAETQNDLEVSITQIAGTAGATAATTEAASDEISVVYDNKTANIKVTGATQDDIKSSINDQLKAAGLENLEASFDADGKLSIASKTAEAKALSITGPQADALFGASTIKTNTGTDTISGYTATGTVDKFVEEINRSFAGQLRASNDGGKLRVENLSTQELDVSFDKDGAGALSASSSTIAGNSVRENLSKQFNELRDQLDKLSDDASFNGINLLRGDKLTITFNETGSSSIAIQAKDSKGNETSVDANKLDIATLIATDLDSDTNIDGLLSKLGEALNSLRSQASAFGSNLSQVQNRQDFTKSMINTLESGAANLTLADTNEEAANLLALQTRQSLSSSALSMASQADQSVLQLLR